MIGFSHLRGDYRNFILENVAEIEILDENFEEKKNSSVEGLIFRNNEHSLKVEVLVDEGVYKRFKANLPAKVFKENMGKSEKIKVSFFGDNLDFINEWLLQFGKSIEIISPKELTEKRKVLLREMLSQ